MDEIKQREIDKIRVDNLRKDLEFLTLKGYNIIASSEDNMRIDIKGPLFDYQKLHALYILSSYYKSDAEDSVIFLEY